MDVRTPLDSFTVLSTANGRISCTGSETAEEACRSIVAEGTPSFPFRFLLDPPEVIVEALDAVDIVRISDRGSEPIEFPVECFGTTGSRGHAEWCYTSAGILISALEGSGGSDWTLLEASAIERPIAEVVFTASEPG